MVILKEIIKKISLFILICFSFFYTDKVINYINNNSSLMKKINSVKEEYKVNEVNGYIDENTIIPGISGKKVNVNKSFDNMKEYNTFIEDYLVYDDIVPMIKLEDNMDKYIIGGNKYKKEVAIIYIVDNNNISKLENIKGITIFINHNILTIDNINKYKNNEIYTYGNNGVYSKSTLINDNTLINNLSNNRSKYCLSRDKDEKVLDICKNNDMYTVIPNIIGDYNDIKNNISNGSIILLNNINNLDNIIKYIGSKGYTITSLNNLLEE